MTTNARGDAVYQCDVCKRYVRVPVDIEFIDIIQRCIITENCLGKLHVIENVGVINSTPVITPEVPGLKDWFQRKVLFTFTQSIQATVWTIVHNLGTKPLVQVVVTREDTNNNSILVELPPDMFTVAVVDLNTVTVTFTRAESGIAQCMNATSSNLINSPIVTPVTLADMLLTNNGEITLATRNTTPLIPITVVYKSKTVITVVYSAVDNVPSINSPWVETSVVYIGGKDYTVRSFNLLTANPAPSYFANGLIVNGSPFYFSGLSVGLGENFILLGNSPFASVDRISDQVIDVASIGVTAPQVYYNQGNAFAKPPVIKQIYPPIFVV